MKIQRGFTLVELIIVIVLTGILAGVVTVFFMPAVDAYFASQRRAALADKADTMVRRLAREIRAAVPNSVRNHGQQCIEFVPTKAGGRYRMGPHVNDDGSSQENTGGDCPDGSRSCTLDLSDTVTQKTAFDVLQISQSSAPVAGDFVVIGNQEVDQVYSGSNRKVIDRFDDPAPQAANGRHRITLGAGDFSSIQGYEAGRFTVVPSSGSVSFVCMGTGVSNGRGTGRLYRVERALGAPTPDTCADPTNAPVLADTVSACQFVYSANPGTQQNGLVWMEISMTDDGENVNLAFAAHVSNVP